MSRSSRLPVTDEYPPGSIAAVGRGRQPDDHHPRARRAPVRYRPAPTRLAGERLVLFDGHSLALNPPVELLLCVWS
jgi:hypothetical protein